MNWSLNAVAAVFLLLLCVTIIPRSFGVPDSGNIHLMIDEHQECTEQQFRCADRCFPLAWVCDGDRDCTDGSDEKNCILKPCSSADQYRCKSGHCIPKRWVCDLERDCSEGEDEANCTAP